MRQKHDREKIKRIGRHVLSKRREKTDYEPELHYVIGRLGALKLIEKEFLD